MGRNRFQDLANKWRNSPTIIFICLVAFGMLAIAIGIFIEDYSTSLEGYRIYPTNKVNSWVIWLVAALPQIGQIGFAYAFMTDSDRKPALLVAIMLHVADVYTDVTYKMQNGNWLAALAESELIYTLGSEIMLTTAFGMFLVTLPDAMRQLDTLNKRLSGSKPQNQGQARKIDRSQSRREDYEKQNNDRHGNNRSDRRGAGADRRGGAERVGATDRGQGRP